MAVNRAAALVDPNTELATQILVGREMAFGFVVTNRDGTRRDLTNDTLTVVAKAANGDALTYTITADANQTETGKGDMTLTMAASQHTSARVGNILYDVAINDRVMYPGTIELIASDAE